ncbi:MAG: kinase [Elusimicrobiota bacterium]
MIISRTPFRISFFGGGTDYPAWFRRNGGAVVSTSINKYCYITCRYLPPFFEHKSRILYSKIENVHSHDEIEHPAVRAILKERGVEEGVEIHHDGDLPARTGLGSSSAFAVGLLHALSALKSTAAAKMQLALEAIHIEQEVLRENVGCQDQVIAALGGFRRIDFRADGEVQTSPITLSPERLELLQNHLLLYFTGFSRIASQIAKEQIDRIPDKTKELKTMCEMVDESIRLLEGSENLDGFGRLLDEGWKLKRGLSSKISTPQTDEAYAAAKSAGALGGKLLGAGGGGFMVFFARPEDHPRIQERLKGLLRVPVRFETGGTQIIFQQHGSS